MAHVVFQEPYTPTGAMRRDNGDEIDADDNDIGFQHLKHVFFKAMQVLHSSVGSIIIVSD